MNKKYKPRYYTPQEIDFKGHPFVGVEWPVTGSTGNAYGVEMTDQGFVCSCICLLYTSPSPRDDELSRMPSSA